MKAVVIELLLAVAAAVGSVLSWIYASATVSVPPILEGEPWTTQVDYNAPLVLMSLMLATIAGVLIVLAVVRMVSGGRAGNGAEAPATDPASASGPS
jgi:hypothetical protein